ncbi:unnamed protein product [Leuciscus chuanchicus]
MDLDKNKSLDDEDLFKDYKPTENDPLTLPKHVIYLLLAVSVTGATLFAIIRHLIKDLIHDLADYLFGEQPMEEQEIPWERRNKFREDWIPEAMPELVAMVNEEQELMEGTEDLPAIWTTERDTAVCADCKLTMFHPQSIVAFIILLVSICQAQAGGQRAASDTSKVTLQPWLVGLAAVVGFLFIVFVLVIVQRLFFKKDKDEFEEKEEKEEKHQFYDNLAADLEASEETKQTNF